MTQRAAETSAFRLSRRAADCIKIDFLIKFFLFLDYYYYFQNKNIF
jgi:hypothetical protein